MRSNLINDAPPSPSQDWGYEPPTGSSGKNLGVCSLTLCTNERGACEALRWGLKQSDRFMNTSQKDYLNMVNYVGG
jgi:hypothetical protein